MIVRKFILLFTLAIFFLALYLCIPKAEAQVSCSLDQLYNTCGTNFACISVTPTPVALNPWIKVKVSNFSANNADTFTNFNIPNIPANRAPFNASDPDENSDNSGNFMIGDSVVQPGVLTAPDVGNIGSNISSNDWKLNKYSKKKTLDARKFLDYATSRKDTHVISSLTDPLVPNKINIYKSPGTFVIDGSNIDNFRTDSGGGTGLTGPTVLIIDGNLDIQRNINYKLQTGYVSDLVGYTPTPLTLIVTGDTSITSVEPNQVNQINAIMISKNFTVNAMATSDTYGLKIKGNLIVSGSFTNNRVRADNRQPVMFIVLDPTMYTSLLPYLSTAQYEWKQVQ